MAETSAVPRHYALSVSGHPLGANARRRATWPVLYRDGKTYRDAVAWQARTLLAGQPPLAVASVVATLIYKRRPFQDPDNAAASCKPLLSGLILGGMIVDDSPERLRLDVRQEVGLCRRIQLDVREVASEVCAESPYGSTHNTKVNA